MSWLGDAARWARADYADWISLGEGGIQHGLPGWLTVTALRPIVRLGELWPAVPEIGAGSPALAGLPRREGPRPWTLWRLCAPNKTTVLPTCLLVDEALGHMAILSQVLAAQLDIVLVWLPKQ